MENSFFDGEEANIYRNQLNSTTVDQENEPSGSDENGKEWKLSPIVADKSLAVRADDESPRNAFKFKKPLRILNLSRVQKADESGYDTRSTDANASQVTSRTDDEAYSFTTNRNASDLDPFSISVSDISALDSTSLRNRSINPFDSILLSSIHKSISFSPSIVLNGIKENEEEEEGESEFKWSVEQLAILKPARITEEEIVANYNSPVPEVEQEFNKILDKFWEQGPSYIPSPDGPRYVQIPNRDGGVTTIVTGCGSAKVMTSSNANTPLCDIVRNKQALRAAVAATNQVIATSSPKQRPRKSLKRLRSCNTQTELTIPPSSDIDFKKLLGEEFIYKPSEECEDEDFNVSMCSNASFGRRLFEDVDDEDTRDESMASITNSGDLFNDDLSPVKQDTSRQSPIDEQKMEDVSNMARPQIVDDLDEDEFDATPRRTEDLDFTPRRVQDAQRRHREFLIGLSPIPMHFAFRNNNGDDNV